MIQQNIFIIISKDIIYRNILDTDFWPSFLDVVPDDIHIVLIVGEKDAEDVSKTHGSSRVTVERYQKVPWKGWAKIVMFFVRSGVDSHSTLLYRKRAYKKKSAGFIQTLGKGFVARVFGNVPFGQHLIRTTVTFLPTSKELKELYEQYKPVAVFAPSLIDTDFDIPVAIEARRRKIQVIGMVRSWDNLNNHGVLPLVPDVFILQNIWLKEAAKKFQHLKIEKYNPKIIGLPHYDTYYDPSKLVMERATFFEGMGLNPEKKLILMGGSDFYYSEDTLPKKINDAIESGAIKEPVQVVFRPHPGKLFSIEEYGLDTLRHVVLNDAFSGEKKFTDADTFVNLLYHADIIISIASTLSIDAAVFDTPAICINFDDPDKKFSYFEEVHRLYDCFDHYERLVGTGGVRTSRSVEALVEDINAYLNNPTLDAEGRRKIIDIFVSPFDGQASQRLAKEVVNGIPT